MLSFKCREGDLKEWRMQVYCSGDNAKFCTQKPSLALTRAFRAALIEIFCINITKAESLWQTGKPLF